MTMGRYLRGTCRRPLLTNFKMLVVKYWAIENLAEPL